MPNSRKRLFVFRPKAPKPPAAPTGQSKQAGLNGFKISPKARFLALEIATEALSQKKPVFETNRFKSAETEKALTTDELVKLQAGLQELEWARSLDTNSVYAVLMKLGDNEAADLLKRNNRPLVLKKLTGFLRQYRKIRRQINLEELVDDCLNTMMIRTIKYYSPQHFVVSTFWEAIIFNTFSNALKNPGRYSQGKEIEKTLPEKKAPHEQHLAELREHILQQVQKLRIGRRKITPREIMIFERLSGLGNEPAVSQDQLAAEAGIPQTTISAIYRAILKNYREQYPQDARFMEE